jgi:hypothetical protein
MDVAAIKRTTKSPYVNAAFIAAIKQRRIKPKQIKKKVIKSKATTDVKLPNLLLNKLRREKMEEERKLNPHLPPKRIILAGNECTNARSNSWTKSGCERNERVPQVCG